MCSIIVVNHKLKEFPLMIAANRDEDYKRPSGPVQVLSQNPLIVGGKDKAKGGTWLAVNEHSLFATITNQGLKDDKLASRGEIPLELLKCKTLDEMVEWVEGLNPSKYNGFNLVFGNNKHIFVAHSYILHSMVISELPEGISVITSDMKFNGQSDKAAFIHQKLEALFALEDVSWLTVYKKLKKILANVDYKIKLKPRKKDGKLYGHCTRSSSILAFSEEGLVRYKFHDRTAYKPRKSEREPYIPRYKDYIDLWRDPTGKTSSASEESEKDDTDDREEKPIGTKKALEEMRKLQTKKFIEDKIHFWRSQEDDDGY